VSGETRLERNCKANNEYGSLLNMRHFMFQGKGNSQLETSSATFQTEIPHWRVQSG